MKFLGYILRNTVRNPVRSLLTIGSTAVCLFLMMMLGAFLAIQTDNAKASAVYNRVIVMSSQGFAQPLPITMVREVAAMKGVVATTPFSWFGGKFGEEVVPFAQFGVDPQTFPKIYAELPVPSDQLKAWQDDRAGCVIGSKLAAERNMKVGDVLPLKGDIYPVDLNLNIRGIYGGPSNTDLRMVFFHWDYLDELLKREAAGQGDGNAGIVVVKCTDAPRMPELNREIDARYLNSPTPTKTQTEEAFAAQFMEMWGDLRALIFWVGAAVVFALIFVAGNAMAMSLRERITEVAVLKAIGFGRGLVLMLILAEAVLVAGIGGFVGALGSKALFDVVDISPYTGGFLPFFYIPWLLAVQGFAVSLAIGFLSGIFPAIRAAQISIIQGLRKVV